MDERITIAVVMVFLFGCVAFILKTAFETLRRNRADKNRADLMNKMLEKFHSGEELTRYLETEGGREFVRAGGTEPRANPFSRVMNSVQAGVVLVVVSTGLLLLRSGVDPDAHEPLLVIGSIGLAIGLGLLLSAASAYILSKKFGLFNGNNPK